MHDGDLENMLHQTATWNKRENTYVMAQIKSNCLK